MAHFAFAFPMIGKIASSEPSIWVEQGQARISSITGISSVEGHKENGQWFVQINGQHDATFVQQNHISVQHVRHLEDEVKYLRETLTRRDEQIESLSLQIDHFSQLLAVAHKSIDQLSDQNRLLLEDNRRHWWKRIRRRRD